MLFRSTLMHLLFRFFEPQQGKILIDGLELQKIDKENYRNHMAMVLQDDFIFSGTILENLKLGSSEKGMEAVIQAAQVAQADTFIRGLPEGYHTEVGERGLNLSRGQRQRIAIARAILRDPQILVLDEATASLDREAESRIFASLRAWMTGKTLIFITHRLHFLEDIDNIIFIDNGEICDTGKHCDLLLRNTKYHNLCVTKFDTSLIDLKQQIV